MKIADLEKKREAFWERGLKIQFMMEGSVTSKEHEEKIDYITCTVGLRTDREFRHSDWKKINEVAIQCRFSVIYLESRPPKTLAFIIMDRDWLEDLVLNLHYRLQSLHDLSKDKTNRLHSLYLNEHRLLTDMAESGEELLRIFKNICFCRTDMSFSAGHFHRKLKNHGQFFEMVSLFYESHKEQLVDEFVDLVLTSKGICQLGSLMIAAERSFQLRACKYSKVDRDKRLYENTSLVEAFDCLADFSKK